MDQKDQIQAKPARKRKNPEQVKAYQAAYYQANKERLSAQGAEWRDKNTEKIRAQDAAYYQANTEKIRAQSAAWQRENAERVKRRKAEYRRENLGKIQEKNAAYYQANSDRLKAKSIAYCKENPEKVNIHSAARRARKAAAPIVENVDRRVLFERDGGICHLCNLPVEWSDMHGDHIVSLKRGGDHSYANMATSHSRCNLRKGCKPLPSPPLETADCDHADLGAPAPLV